MNRDLGLSMTANGKTGVAIICLATGLFILYYTTAVQQSSIPYIAKSVSPIGNEYISSAENNSLVGKLLIVTEAIIKSDLKWSRGESNTLLKDAFNEMSNIFETLGHTNQLKQLQESLVSVSQPVKNSDVCQENYVKKDVAKSDPKYIFYRRIGFYQDNCTDVPPFHSLLTLVYNFVHYDSKYHSYIPELLHEANNLYTNLPILAAIPENFSIHDKDFRNTTLIRMNASMAEPDIWNSLVTKVKTKYVYIGRNVIKFTWHDRLERLVREINNLEASVVASSYRTLQSGVWSNGCEQSKLYNYILEYRSGYKTSKEECLVCHHVHGPFVTLTHLLQQTPFKSQISSTSSFAIWFLQLKKKHKKIVSCADAMAFLIDESQKKTTKKDWLDLAQFLKVEFIRMNKQLMELNCEEWSTSCSKLSRSKGFAVSWCCKRELSTAIQFTMSLCTEHHLVCQLNAGTSLGAIKVNNVLPWETVDADILLHPDNITAFEKLESTITQNGYRYNTVKFGYYHIHTAHWTVEVFADSLQTPASAGVTPTRIEFDGQLLETVINPGLFGRNMYGSEMYQHAQHWRGMKADRSNIWEYFHNAQKKFSQCPEPGHHACLDQFEADGNLEFAKPSA